MTHGLTESALHDLRHALEAVFAADTAVDPRSYRGGADGHCAAVSAIVQALWGGVFMSTTDEGVSHWYNRLVIDDGTAIDTDLTGDQFGRDPVRVALGPLYAHARVRTRDDLTDETLRRAILLSRRADIQKAASCLEAELHRRQHRDHA